ncbi:hypothetical protein ACHAXA_008134 [Cyclostephanos tholiformis]|uniref:SAP domain-containing protein n=1 Tax=Cyclostephanos tholiformis TaxID=382380 RepID=A0ABD3SEL9_9STRA
MTPAFLWDKDKVNDKEKSDEQRQYYNDRYEKNRSDTQKQSSQLITPNMEKEVMASARVTMDSNTLSRALSSFIDDGNNGSGESNFREIEKEGTRSLRDLALLASRKGRIQSASSGNIISSVDKSKRKNDNSWDTNQIAVASGATIFLLSPLVIPIIHSLLPPIIPFPSSLSFTGAALLGTISYIVALGDPTDQSNIISGVTGGGVLGDGVEVGGALSRIVGRTALQSAQASTPRLKAAARAIVDYDTTAATIEELTLAQKQLSQTVSKLKTENEKLRKEVALWKAVEDIQGMYKLEELKEIARYHGLKGYSSDGKNALLRRLVKEGILTLDLTPYIYSMEDADK